MSSIYFLDFHLVGRADNIPARARLLAELKRLTDSGDHLGQWSDSSAATGWGLTRSSAVIGAVWDRGGLEWDDITALCRSVFMGMSERDKEGFLGLSACVVYGPALEGVEMVAVNSQGKIERLVQSSGALRSVLGCDLEAALEGDDLVDSIGTLSLPLLSASSALVLPLRAAEDARRLEAALPASVATPVRPGRM